MHSNSKERAMTKLTTERLETIATWREKYGNGANVMIPAEEAELMARQLLAYEQAAKNPVAEMGAARTPLYAAPVLPKQPELLPIISERELFKVWNSDIDCPIAGLEPSKAAWKAWIFRAALEKPVMLTELLRAINLLLDSDGSRGCFDALEQHRAKTELERLLAEVQQNEPQNIPENIPAQPVIPEHANLMKHSSVIAEQLEHVLSGMDVTDHQRAVISSAIDRLNKSAEILQQKPTALIAPEKLDYQSAKDIFNYLMNEEETNATVNGWNACRAEMLKAQPVSEPYKLNGWISVDNELPEEGARVFVFSDGAFVLLAEFTGGEFYDVVRDGEEFFETVTRCVTHWMPLPAAPAQESE